MLVKLGDLWHLQREFGAAISSYQSALKHFEAEMSDEELGRTFAAERGNTSSRIALCLSDQSRIEEAKREFQTAIRQLGSIVDNSDDPLARRYLAATLIKPKRRA